MALGLKSIGNDYIKFFCIGIKCQIISQFNICPSPLQPLGKRFKARTTVKSGLV